MTEKLIIIGAGQAGLQVAATLRQKDYTGKILMIGDEAHLPYERPPLSKGFLKGLVPAERLSLKPAAFYQDKAIDCLTGVAVTRIDRRQKRLRLSDHSEQTYEKLVLATGSRARTLDIPGIGLAGVQSLRTLEDAAAIAESLRPGQRLVIAGGGYIGLEVAAAARSLGIDVTLLEIADRVMQRTATPHLSEFFQKEHASQGVDIRLNTGIASIEGKGRVERVFCSDGASLAADTVIIGIGVIPNQTLAEDAGLAVNDGVLVDEFAATSDPYIYAAGDCARHPNACFGGLVRLESVQNAVDQAKCAAFSILGTPQPYREIPWFWSDQYDLKLQIAGLWRQDDQVIVRGDPATRKFSLLCLRNGALAAISTINNLQDFLPAKKLIAAGACLDTAAASDPAIPLKTFL